MEVTEQQIKTAVFQIQKKPLPLVAGVTGFLFFLYAFAQATLLQEPRYVLLSAYALVCFLILSLIYWASSQDRIPDQWTEHTYGIIAALVWSSTYLRILFGEPKQAASLILFMMAAAIVFVSHKYFGLAVVYSLGGWAFWLFTQWQRTGTLEGTDWIFYGLLLTSSAATAAMIHIYSARIIRELVTLRIREKRQRLKNEHQAMQLETNIDIGHQLTSILDQTELLAKITTILQNRYQLEYVGVYLASSGRLVEKFAPAAEAGRRSTDVTADRDAWQTVLQDVSSTQTKFRLETEYRQGTPAAHQRVTLLLPLNSIEESLGVLVLQSHPRFKINEDDERNFELIADQVTIALENARLYDHIKQFNHQLEGMVAERTAELQTAYARLERLDKTKADFITIASHEMKTPLTLIDLYSQMFQNEPIIAENPTFKKWADGMQKGTDRLTEVVERMLDVAQIDSETLNLYFAPLQLSFLLPLLQNRFRHHLAEREQTLSIIGLANLPEIEADTEALEKVFHHLLLNAIKYTPDGGEIVINGRFQPDAFDTGGVEITVRDNGIGISPAVQELIFEKFFQTGEVMLHSSGRTSFKGGGAGLGLAIAKGIVEAHNGRIWVESDGYNEETRSGSRFYILLPVKQPHKEPFQATTATG